MTEDQVNRAYALAKEQYAEIGVDTDAAVEQLGGVSLSLHCWQGDDVMGFESGDTSLDGSGIQCTGNYPGRARTPGELRADLEEAMRHIPCKHRLNLHAIYGEFGGRKVERDAVAPEHFQGWIDWAREKSMGLDFNPTFFAHPKADDGLTLAHPDADVRRFWIAHGQACRRIAAEMGRQLGSACINNIWIPDGYKDQPYKRQAARERLVESLDAVLEENFARAHQKDAVESKLFGIGSESCVIGSHEFYLAYALSHGVMVCLDAGHFHPTEVISDKISSLLCFFPELLLHVSRPVRWDSDHVVTLSDELQSIAQEIVRSDSLNRVHLGLDWFDATINRVAAWVIGSRNVLKALLMAMLEPRDALAEAEAAGDFTSRLAWVEEQKSMPLGAVWDYHCLKRGSTLGRRWFSEVRRYEDTVLKGRG